MSKILCVLDGFGLTPNSKNNVPAISEMPNLKKILGKYKWYTLNADGGNVGQENGLVGNSEVGHMNIGGLKLVPQLSYQITKSSENSFDLKKELAPDQLFDPKKLLQKTFISEENSKAVHLIGLFSKGKIHSDLRHWAGAIEAAGESGAEKIVLHIISDGRDSDRKSLVETWDYFTSEFTDRLKPFENKIFLGSLGGRFYSMDRDNNWDRVMLGISYLFKDQNDDKLFENKYKLQPQKIRDEFSDKVEKAMNENLDIVYPDNFEELDQLEMIKADLVFYSQKNYKKNIFDENIFPTAFSDHLINKNDTVWLLNFRTDRMKQFGKVLTEINQELAFNLTVLSLNDYCFGGELYLDESLEIKRQKTDTGYYPIFKNQPVKNPLAEYISGENKTQLHIAETEKYNHVTYFLNGGQDKKWPGEEWVVIDSNKVTSHSQKPKMKAGEITDYILEKGLSKYDYIIVNYANPDMLGHTGDIAAGIESMEFLDVQIGRLLEAVESGQHDLIIIADHGNIEFVGGYEKSGRSLTDTEHNANAVPFIIISKDFEVEKVLSNLANFAKNNTLDLDLSRLKSVLEKDNRIALDKNSWLTSEQIPTNILPLWVSGLMLVNL